ncbi:MAG: hypothetical protein CMJ83_07895 [Planctomycetes bacterium]|nr:hypothetical protein [Planctomycetota bacterium]
MTDNDSGTSGPPTLSDLLERHRQALVRFLEKEARGLFRWENADDLAQGIHLQALQVEDRFDYQGEEAFIGWIFQVARQHIARRNAHWKAIKRDAGMMLRISTSDSSVADGPRSGIDPAISMTGPVTFADRRDRLRLAVQAIAVLPERDREIVQWMAEDVDIKEMAERLAITYDAAQRARHRSLERFRQAYAVLEQRRRPGP